MRRSARPVLVSIGVATLASSCVSGPVPGSSDDRAAAARGEMLAKRACNACHGVGLEEASSFPNARPFRAMRMNYNAISNERHRAQLHAGARPGMPPAAVSLTEVADLAAYVRSSKAALKTKAVTTRGARL